MDEEIRGADGIVGAAVVLPGMEGALNPLDEAQIRSAAARRIFEVEGKVKAEVEGEAAAWMDEYFGLVSEGWPWRQAVFILWSAQPKRDRRPRTQGGLATEVLGLESDRVIRKWRAENLALEARIAQMVRAVLGHHRADVLRALAASASSDNYRAHSDRKLFLEMSGDYVPRQVVGVGPVGMDEMGSMGAEELRALAGAGGEQDLRNERIGERGEDDGE